MTAKIKLIDRVNTIGAKVEQHGFRCEAGGGKAKKSKQADYKNIECRLLGKLDKKTYKA